MPMTMVREAWTDERLDELAKRVDEGFREVKAEQRALRAELKAEMNELRGEMRELKKELKGEMLELKKELKGEMSELRGELAQLNRRFDALLTTLLAGFVALVLAQLLS